MNLNNCEIEPTLLSARKTALWRLCALCGGKLRVAQLDIARHQAGEWLKSGLLGGEDEATFASTRDDLGWSVQVYYCPHCKKIRPFRLRHQR